LILLKAAAQLPTDTWNKLKNMPPYCFLQFRLPGAIIQGFDEARAVIRIMLGY